MSTVANKFVVLLDMDSTVYDLLSPTLDYVNKKYGMSLGPANITEWRWDVKYDVNPMKFWNMEGTYLNLKPFDGAAGAIWQVHQMGVRQVFLSSANFKFATEKFQAVDRDFPFIGSKDVLLTGGNKDLANGDILVDDGPHNLKQFAATGGKTVLANMVNAPYCSYPQADDSMTHWYQYPNIVKNLMNGWKENVGG